jgi:hypothetical protein
VAITIYSRAVKAAFKKDEWTVLETHVEFMRMWNECDSSDDVDKLCLMGDSVVSKQSGNDDWIRNGRKF